MQFAKKRAEKIRLIEEAERKALEESKSQAAAKELEVLEVEISDGEKDFENHEWLVE